jgi:hypothetical protein
MPSYNPGKGQINCFVPNDQVETFRRLAAEYGFGRKPSPLMGMLLEVFTGDMEALNLRLRAVVKEEPHKLKDPIQRDHAQKIIKLLQGWLEL